MIETILEDALYQWANSVLPQRAVIFANPLDGPAPHQPYTLFTLQENQVAQNPIVTLNENDKSEQINQSCLTRVCVDCIGDLTQGSAQSHCLTLAASLYSGHRYQDLWQVAGLGGISIAPQCLTTATLGVNRPRWHYEFTLYRTFTITATEQYFTQTTLQININDTALNPISLHGETL